MVHAHPTEPLSGETIRFRVRRATLRDLDTLVHQRHMMFEDIRHRTQDEHARGDHSYRRWARKEMKAGRLVSFLVVTGDDRPVAGGAVWLRETQPSPRFAGGRLPYLMSMYTEPGHRRRGLASKVVEQAESWARSKGYPWMTLHASEMGRPLYKRLGWDEGNELRRDLISAP